MSGGLVQSGRSSLLTQKVISPEPARGLAESPLPPVLKFADGLPIGVG